MIVAPRRRTPLFALFAANSVSLTGNVLAMVAIPWFVLETTGSAVRTGLTGAVATVPFILAGIFGGTLVDRFGFKRMSILADLASGVTVAAVPLLYHTTGLAFWQLLVLVFLGALLDAPGATARAGLLPDLARLAGMHLERVNALEQTAGRLAYTLGPVLAGLLIAVTSPSNVLWLDAASFAISAAVVSLLVPGAATPAKQQRTPYLEELRAGWRFMRADVVIFTTTSYIVLTNFLDSAISLTFPVYAERELGSAVHLGLMLAAGGAGAVASTIAFAAVGHRLPRRETFIYAFVLTSLPLFVVAATPAFGLLLAALVVRGLGAGPLNPVLMTVEQERVPAELRGRVFGLIGALCFLMIPAGRLVSGYMIEGLGLAPTLLALASVYLAITVSMLFHPALRLLGGPGAGSDTTHARIATPRLVTSAGGEE